MKKRSIALIFMIVTFFACTAQTKKRIIFFGDSITELGIKPGGYISVLKNILSEKGMAQDYELIGSGVSSNKIYDLYLRMEEDVLARSPSIVVIWIGVNDVWHKKSMGTGTDADKFKKFYQVIINKLKARNINLILCTPAVIGEKWDVTNELDGDLNNYAAIIRNLAHVNNCRLLDFRNIFMNYYRVYNKENKEKGILTYDKVHLNDAGNALVAREVFRVLAAL
jgi:lysophospholipase L1-like esterase